MTSAARLCFAEITLTDAANTTFSSTFTRANNGPGNYVKFSRKPRAESQEPRA